MSRVSDKNVTHKRDKNVTNDIIYIDTIIERIIKKKQGLKLIG
jgi:hypothetical protein